MDYSKRVDMISAYKEPVSYQPPETLPELVKSTDYPNRNSLQYRLTEQVPLPANKLPPALDLATVNGAGNVIVAGNSYTDRLWAGGFCGWETVADIGVEEKVSFSRRCEAVVTALRYTLDDALVRMYSGNGRTADWL